MSFIAFFLSQSGGCDIGTRPINLHISAFKKLGVDIKEENGFVICNAEKIVGTNINLDFPSVGATENIILASCMAEGTTTINNAAMEPEIIDLVSFLKKMGAKIIGEGTSRITIIGVSKLKATNHNVMPDRIETGTFLCAAAATGGEIIVKNTEPKYVEAVLNKLEECGCYIECKRNSIILGAPKKLKSVEIKTTTYPGFPTDMQQIFAAMLLKANGTSVIIENIFENRYKYISELRKMSTKILQDGRVTIITGKRKIQSAELACTDLRGGAAIVIASLIAKGESRISNINYLLRGYERFDYKLINLGAKIRVK
ncbi:MAG: UDP-N-acetylglucosamine 1-carboxyvinyltransferase [Clostridia bacterium]|nr:UDP-N-acetylglucosamine 1-carboxyvinyltransferase [Clostridia bacterium]